MMQSNLNTDEIWGFILWKTNISYSTNAVNLQTIEYIEFIDKEWYLQLIMISLITIAKDIGKESREKERQNIKDAGNAAPDVYMTLWDP